MDRLRININKYLFYQMNQLINPYKKIVNYPMWEPKIKKKATFCTFGKNSRNMIHNVKCLFKFLDFKIFFKNRITMHNILPFSQKLAHLIMNIHVRIKKIVLKWKIGILSKMLNLNIKLLFVSYYLLSKFSFWILYYALNNYFILTATYFEDRKLYT